MAESAKLLTCPNPKARLCLFSISILQRLWRCRWPRSRRAQFRFAFGLPDGDEEWLLARLCPVEPDCAGERFHHCMVLRPENAEPSRVFVAENLWYRAGRRALDSWMTPAQAKRWKWDLFEQSFNDNDYTRGLARFWAPAKREGAQLLRFGADGWGAVSDRPGGDGWWRETERFIWQHKRFALAHEAADLKFLRASTASFRRKARALWREQDGPIQTTLRWMRLSDAEKNARAFECERGSWAQLREVAAWVLILRIARLKRRPEAGCVWDFVSYGWIRVSDAPALDDDAALFAWRDALTQAFGARGVDGAGVKIDSLPLCVWSYIDDHDQAHIEIAPPSMHEILEAQIQLRDWTRQHFALNEAARLLDCLDITFPLP